VVAGSTGTGKVVNQAGHYERLGALVFQQMLRSQKQAGVNEPGGRVYDHWCTFD